jgi:hypothetical protein
MDEPATQGPPPATTSAGKGAADAGSQTPPAQQTPQDIAVAAAARIDPDAAKTLHAYLDLASEKPTARNMGLDDIVKTRGDAAVKDALALLRVELNNAAIAASEQGGQTKTNIEEAVRAFAGDQAVKDLQKIESLKHGNSPEVGQAVLALGDDFQKAAEAAAKAGVVGGQTPSAQPHSANAVPKAATGKPQQLGG